MGLSSSTLSGLASRSTGSLPVLAAGFLIQCCLGLLFAWTAFHPVLMAAFGWDEAVATAPYRYALLSFCAGLLFGWRFLRSRGPALTAAVGGILASFGLILCAVYGADPLGLTLAFGLVSGLGIGFAYMAPISAVLGEFAEGAWHYGALAALGLLAGAFGLPFAIDAFLHGSAPLFHEALPDAYALLAILMLVGVVLPSRFLQSDGWADSQRTTGAAAGSLGLVFRSWLLWVVFFLGATVCLGMLVRVSPLLASWNSLPAWSSAGAILLLMSAGNFAGAELWQRLRTRYGQARTRGVLFSVGSGATLVLGAGDFSVTQFILVLSMLGFAFGGFLSIMPTLARHMLEFRSLAEGAAVLLAAYGASTLFRIPTLTPEGALGWMDTLLILTLGVLFLAGVTQLLRRDLIPASK